MLTIKKLWSTIELDKSDTTYDTLVCHSGYWDDINDEMSNAVDVFNDIESQYLVDMKKGWASVDYVKMIKDYNLETFFKKENFFEEDDELEYNIVNFLMYINAGYTSIQTTINLVKFMLNK